MDNFNNDIDILNELSKATEYKNEAPQEAPKEPGTESEPQQAQATGEGLSTEIETFDFDFEPESDEPESDEPESENFDVSEASEVVITLVDQALTSLLPMLYKNTLPSHERKILNKMLDEKSKGKDGVFDEEMKANESLYKDYIKYKNSIPTSDEDKKRIDKPLKKELAKINLKMDNTTLLWSTIAMVLAPKVFPPIANKFK